MSDVQGKLDALVRQLKISREEPASAAVVANGHGATVSDEAVIEKCRGARNAAKFSDLFDHGDVHRHHGGDESVADLALLGMLAYYTQDESQLERLFSSSALGWRGKWRNRLDYRRRTIKRALKDLGETYDWGRNRGRRLVSSLSSPLGSTDDNDTSEEPEIVWFAELGEPEERKYLIEKVGVKGYPIVVFGAGGVAKSFGVLAAGIAIASASGVGEWLGFEVVEHGHVLYVDFELDISEQHRRVRDLCNGLGVLIPKRLAYLSGVGIPVDTTFKKAREFAKDYEAKAVIIDSIGLALEGDMERSKDVLAFYRRHIDPFRNIGTTPFLVDHEGKLQTGEKHRNKSPIGSAFKAWAARNVLQFELDEYDKENSALDVRVRQQKTNFMPVEPFGARFTFEEKKVSIKPRVLPDTELVEEDRIPVKARIMGALRGGGATNVDLQKLTGAEAGTIRNKLSELMQEGAVVADEGRPKTYYIPSDDGPDFVTREGASEGETEGEAKEEVSLSSPFPKGGDNDDTNKNTAQASTSENNQIQDEEMGLQGVGERLAAFLMEPPGWFANQATHTVREGAPERLLNPLASTVSAHLFGSPARWRELKPEIERYLESSSGDN